MNASQARGQFNIYSMFMEVAMGESVIPLVPVFSGAAGC